MKLPSAARYFWTTFFFLCVAWVLLLSFPEKQHHISITHDFGIGFDLSPSYGTVAVSYPNGSIHPIAKVEGDAAYRKLMLRLSLPSSQHIQYASSAPFISHYTDHLASKPHQNVREAIDDIPRQAWRDSRKKIGLPASGDVGTISNMVKALREQASSFVGQAISVAAISVPHLAALYGEDLHDAFEYLSLGHLELYPFWNLQPIPSTVAAYAGNGLGLCENYTDTAACHEEEARIPRRYALAVSYTHGGLITSQSKVALAYGIEEIPSLENLKLGYDARHGEYYWEKVRHMLRSPVVDSLILRNVSMVLLQGDASELPQFREILDEVVDDVIRVQPDILDQEPIFSASKGTAELAKRAIFRQMQTTATESEL
ncbi:hypothetical protein SCAR479_00465 [Seiridium cardinale]|uniref:Uncharacterized protein n=1 Tax=Seiridium cardinale TaxID=138064 RepID=A0ABR2YAF2_9PEZI